MYLDREREKVQARQGKPAEHGPGVAQLKVFLSRLRRVQRRYRKLEYREAFSPYL